ncbi:hypothetical protein H6P81_009996 [Aristolochia fimbriata]|uniref:Uncharacterized protein n=1 Tax=Aristolochia fimbriata TaxID=158543 RepID=A0AAV7EQW2_ARIFI|nr:hypothetical protein H6P81_009996 [Aristolochia fimbriata]
MVSIGVCGATATGAVATGVWATVIGDEGGPAICALVVGAGSDAKGVWTTVVDVVGVDVGAAWPTVSVSLDGVFSGDGLAGLEGSVKEGGSDEMGFVALTGCVWATASGCVDGAVPDTWASSAACVGEVAEGVCTICIDGAVPGDSEKAASGADEDLSGSWAAEIGCVGVVAMGASTTGADSVGCGGIVAGEVCSHGLVGLKDIGRGDDAGVVVTSPTNSVAGDASGVCPSFSGSKDRVSVRVWVIVVGCMDGFPAAVPASGGCMSSTAVGAFAVVTNDEVGTAKGVWVTTIDCRDIVGASVGVAVFGVSVTITCGTSRCSGACILSNDVVDGAEAGA